MKNKIWPDRQTLKSVLNFWTFITMALFILDFFSGNKFDSSASAIGIIYLAILGIYAGEKEYTRWQDGFVSRFIGEFFLVIWTILMAVFAVAAPVSAGAFKIPADFAIIYTSVVGVFAVTQRSKALKAKKHTKKDKT